MAISLSNKAEHAVQSYAAGKGYFMGLQINSARISFDGKNEL